MLSGCFIICGSVYLWQFLFTKVFPPILTLIHAGCLAVLIAFCTLSASSTDVGDFFVTAVIAGFMAVGAGFGGGIAFFIVGAILLAIADQLKSSYLVDEHGSFRTHSEEHAKLITALLLLFSFAWNVPLHVVLWLPPATLHSYVGSVVGFTSIGYVVALCILAIVVHWRWTASTFLSTPNVLTLRALFESGDSDS